MLIYFRKYAAEVLGTFFLSSTVLIGLSGHPTVPVAVMAALTLGLFVYTLSGVSGTHINPAVSIGLFSVKKISLIELFWYVSSQFFGAELGFYFATLFAPSPMLQVKNNIIVGIAEMIGTFVLAFGVASVVYKKVPTEISGVAIGGSLLLGLLIASVKSNGVLNPAVALSIGSFSLMYILGPLAGGIAGMWAFKFLVGE